MIPFSGCAPHISHFSRSSSSSGGGSTFSERPPEAAYETLPPDEALTPIVDLRVCDVKVGMQLDERGAPKPDLSLLIRASIRELRCPVDQATGHKHGGKTFAMVESLDSVSLAEAHVTLEQSDATKGAMPCRFS